MKKRCLTTACVMCLLFAAQASWSLQWNFTTVDNGWRTGSGSSIALDQQGNVGIAYYDYTNQYLKYASRNGNVWSKQTIADCDLRTEIGPTLIYNSYGKANILYRDPSGVITFATQDTSSTWSTQSIPGLGTGMGYYSMTQDSSGRYYATNTTWSDGINYAVFDGTSWNTQSLPSSMAARHYSSIAVDGQGNPYIAYQTLGAPASIMCAKLVSGTWITDIAGTTDGGDGKIRIATDAQGRPHICYMTWSGALMYSVWNGAQWVKASALSVSKYSWDCSMVLDSNGNPYIAHMRESDYSLWLAHWNGSSWTDQFVSSNCYGESNILLDSSNRLHITYYGNNSGNLVYATTQLPMTQLPEPGCLSALLIGFSGLFALRRRQTR